MREKAEGILSRSEIGSSKSRIVQDRRENREGGEDVYRAAGEERRRRRNRWGRYRGDEVDDAAEAGMGYRSDPASDSTVASRDSKRDTDVEDRSECGRDLFGVNAG
jgi:hypothetical protein